MTFTNRTRSGIKLLVWVIIVIAGTLVQATNVFAANITHDTSRVLTHVLIEGDIEAGDYEKFVDAVLMAGSEVYSVYVASKGGNVAEAMRIGRLIRELKLQTQVPKYIPVDTNFSPRGPYCDDLPIAESNCTCMSACVIVYLSGVYRYGDYLGVHRAFLDHEYLKTLSMEEGSRYSRIVSNSVDAYLDSMGAPASLIEMIGSVPSSEIEILNNKYVGENLEGYSRDFQEWFIAKCGDSSKNYNLARNEKDSAKSDEIFAKFKESYECEKRVLDEERKRAFYPAIMSAFSDLDESLIPRRSLLASLMVERDFDLSRLIGKSNLEAMDLLALVGIATRWSPVDIKGLNNATYKITSSISVGFDTDGTVYSVDIPFYDSDETEQTPYRRHFLNGLNARSSPQQFSEVLGEPKFEPRCWGSGVCFLIWQTEHADIQVLFEREEKRPRAISLHRPGYWDDMMDSN